MRLVSIPGSFKLLALGMLGMIPLILWEVLLLQKAPWWRLSWKVFYGMGGVVTAILIFLALAVLLGQHWVYWVSVFFFVLWWIVSFFFVWKMRIPSLAFFTFSLGLLAFAELGWLRWELKRSFMDPCWKWYQGRPRRIPELKCEIRAAKDQIWECYVCRMDRRGIFVYQVADQPELAPWMVSQKKLEFVVRFQKVGVALEGIPTQVLPQNQGLGIRFFALSVDRRKQLGDLLATLEGLGYV